MTIKDRMQGGWIAGLPETPCGRGSTIEYAENVARCIPVLIRGLEIETVNNIGAGDLKWFDHYDVEYHSGPGVTFSHFDVVSRDERVHHRDITAPDCKLPKCDLTICRDVLIHLTDEEICTAISNIRRTSLFALFSTHDAGHNEDLRGRNFRRINLELEPWSMGPTLGKIMEKTTGVSMGIWEM